MNNNDLIKNETIENIVKELNDKKMISLIGGNMSGKTTLLRRLRGEINKECSIVIHIENALNQFLISRNKSPFEAIRIDDLFKLSNKLPELTDFNNIIKNTNKSMNELGFNININLEYVDKKMANHNIDNPLNKVLRTYLGVNELEAGMQDVWLKAAKEYIYKFIELHNLKKSEIIPNQEAVFLEFDGRPKIRLTQGSSGLEVLVVLFFVVETIFFLIQKEKTKLTKFYLFIDELELYLHPDWQKKVLTYFEKKVLSSKNKKGILNVIYTTHSPHLIPLKRLDCIGITEYKDNEIFFQKILDEHYLEIPNRNKLNLNRLSLVEQALGIDLSIQSTPFCTVEGDEELKLFSQFALPSISKIFNINGTGNFAPYIVLARGKKIPAIFILDADVDFNKILKNIAECDKTVQSLKENFIFVGKKLYDFDEAVVGLKCTKEECLEDFFAVNVFSTSTNEAKGYKKLFKLSINKINEVNYEIDKKIKEVSILNANQGVNKKIEEVNKKIKEIIKETKESTKSLVIMNGVKSIIYSKNGLIAMCNNLITKEANGNKTIAEIKNEEVIGEIKKEILNEVLSSNRKNRVERIFLGKIKSIQKSMM